MTPEIYQVQDFVCPNGHPFSPFQGSCPWETSLAPTEKSIAAAPARGWGGVNAQIRVAYNSLVVSKLSPGVKRTPHSYGWENKKIGVVNHIPVCQADPATNRTGLQVLTDYFTGGNAQGSTHYGIAREQKHTVTLFGYSFPVAEAHMYLEPWDDGCPWAQGIIRYSAACPLGLWLPVQEMRPGEPNGAFVSFENIAMSGADGVTDAQFNSNVILRVTMAQYFGFEIEPDTQGWHGEIDNVDRCVAVGTRVLTQDLQWVPIETLKEGDLLLAFDDVPTIKGNRRALRHGTVLSAVRRQEKVYKLTTSKGTVLRSTGEHRWLVRRGVAPSGVMEWVRTDELFARQGHNKFGSYLPRFFEPWATEESYQAGYLAAAYDGEGSLLSTVGRSPVLSFAQKDNAMLARMVSYLDERGIKYALRYSERTQVYNIVIAEFREMARLVGSIRPVRLLGKWTARGVEGQMMRADQVADEKIVSVEEDGVQDIIVLTTSTGTFFAEGFAAHNCNDPGWPGWLENEMQDAARRLRAGDASKMRKASLITPKPKPPAPHPEDRFKQIARNYLASLQRRSRELQDDINVNEQGVKDANLAIAVHREQIAKLVARKQEVDGVIALLTEELK